MPSPIAHTAVGLALWPLLPGDGVRALSRGQRIALVGGVVFMLNGPDVDIIAGMTFGAHAFAHHPSVTHSFAAAVVMAGIFAAGARLLTALPFARLWLVGFLAWSSHVVLDACTGGKGVPMFWPLTGEQMALPIALFYGVRHSQPWAVDLHAITVISELPFVLLMWFVGCRMLRRRERPERGPALHARCAP
jgi:membrane-bound metal-dependent hydrolase YbcI (DUF457 family)